MSGMRAMAVYVYQLVAPQLRPTKLDTFSITPTGNHISLSPTDLPLIPSSVYISVLSAYSAGAPVSSLLSHPAVPWA